VCACAWLDQSFHYYGFIDQYYQDIRRPGEMAVIRLYFGVWEYVEMAVIRLY